MKTTQRTNKQDTEQAHLYDLVVKYSAQELGEDSEQHQRNETYAKQALQEDRVLGTHIFKTFEVNQ